MRFITSFLCVLLLGSFSLAQQKRYLVTPYQEVMPIPPGSSAENMMTKYNKSRAAASVTDVCSGGTIFGFDPPHFAIGSLFGFSHKDVMGEWFVAPARGTIDTFYFQTSTNGTIVALDSTVIVRIFKSNLTQGHGPGFDYPAPCRSWGYWVNTTDPENGIAPFIEDATDTNWHSTAQLNGSPNPSFEPFGLSVWGLSGVPLKLKPAQVNAIPMDIIPGGFKIKPHTSNAKDTIDIGEAFFYSMKMNSLPGVEGNYGGAFVTQFAASNSGPFPARNWKFYEHDSGPSPTCSGTPVTQIKKGWVARGPLSGTDTTAGSAYNVWYVMTATTNVPPKINSVDGPSNTLSTATQPVSATIFDCDAENPTFAGIKTATMRYTVANLAGVTLSSGTAPLDNIGGDTYLGNLPSVAKNSIVTYKLFASDSANLFDSSAFFSYKVIDFNSAYYRMDTTTACAPMSIVSGGTVIDTSKWFLPTTVSTAARHAGDDGTAGPYPLGGPFIYFGDTVNFAWVGVNGAIALTKTAAETLDVSSNGFATTGFDLPQRQYRNRSDTNNQQNNAFMPKNFIAPFWADWITKQDSPIATFGHVRVSSTVFPGKFIVEYDSLGDFITAGAVTDNDKFRVILDRTAGTIQFQYDAIGIGGLDTLNLTGMNSDSVTHPGSITPFNYFNRFGSPSESRLHGGLCVTYYPVRYSTAATDGWNMVSVGTNPPSHAKSFLYPSAISPNAFGYHGSYVPTQVLPSGPGFWVKFSGSQSLDALGSTLSTVDVALDNGWNMVGSVSTPVVVTSLTTTPPSIVTSPYFGFSGSYFVASTLTPGKAYWAKTLAAGTLHITGSGAVPKQAPGIAELAGLDKLSVQDKLGRSQTLYIGSDGVLSADAASKYEMPPAAPDGALNVRYASQRMVEVYPSQVEAGKQYEYPVTIDGAVYPLTVKWEAARGSEQKLMLVAATAKESKVLGIMEGTGKVTITDAAVTKLVVKLTSGLAVPKEFALSQNYPNPFNPTTHFSVDIPRASAVDVTVYDVLGRKITTLMSGEQEAGYHIMEWDSKDSHGLNVPSGMYMVRMTAGDFSAVKKIMLMK